MSEAPPSSEELGVYGLYSRFFRAINSWFTLIWPLRDDTDYSGGSEGMPNERGRGGEKKRDGERGQERERKKKHPVFKKKKSAMFLMNGVHLGWAV